MASQCFHYTSAVQTSKTNSNMLRAYKAAVWEILHLTTPTLRIWRMRLKITFALSVSAPSVQASPTATSFLSELSQFAGYGRLESRTWHFYVT
jgi:hypothetical protein